MKHRERLLSLTLAILFFIAPIAAEAQQPAKVSTIGFLSQFPGSATSPPAHIKTLLEGLKELGYVEGKNIVMEYRFAEGKVNRLPELAAELVQQKVDIIATVHGVGGCPGEEDNSDNPHRDGRGCRPGRPGTGRGAWTAPRECDGADLAVHGEHRETPATSCGCSAEPDPCRCALEWGWESSAGPRVGRNAGCSPTTKGATALVSGP